MNDVLSAVAAPVPVSIDHRPRVEELLKEIFALMKYPATLEFKDMPDGALGVAVHFSGELPGITPGKRSYLIDCIQFLVNKAINRPNVQRRWVNLGVNAFPEPRSQAARAAEQPEKVAEVAVAPPPVSRREAKERDPRNAKPEKANKPEPVEKREPRQRSGGPDERSLAVAPDPKWTAVAQSLAKKSVQHGRVYALMMLSTDDRARVLAAAGSTPGLTVKVEGEGHWRRVAFVPEKIAPILKKQVMPDYDDDEDE
jgi:predicted RNA-binding protein Jag